MVFENHFVAFLDILGFSEMVRYDSTSSDKKYLEKLYKCHQSASHIFSTDLRCTITQFSDSILLATPYSSEKFDWFIRNIAEYQRFLLNENLLCRGGIAINKHFNNGSFTFSAGLIDAYFVESKIAKYPRVVISKDVIDLIFPEGTKKPNTIIKEDDGMYFIDFLGLTKRKKPKLLNSKIQEIIEDLSKSNMASVKEKSSWLAAYSDYRLKTSFSKTRFNN